MTEQEQHDRMHSGAVGVRMSLHPSRWCPRCGKGPIDPQGTAFSRVDSRTMICPRCGIDETMIVANTGLMAKIHPVTGMKRWVNTAAAQRALGMASHPSFHPEPGE